jgi:hypothetical protein
MSSPHPKHVRASSLSRVTPAYPSPYPDSNNPSQTCLTPGLDMSSLTLAPQRLSPSQPYPAPYSGSKELSRTCSATSPDMSSLSALTRVKSQNRIYPVPKPGYRDGCRTYPTPDPEMFGSLTPQWLDSLGRAIKVPPCLSSPGGHELNWKTLPSFLS